MHQGEEASGFGLVSPVDKYQWGVWIDECKSPKFFGVEWATGVVADHSVLHDENPGTLSALAQQFESLSRVMQAGFAIPMFINLQSSTNILDDKVAAVIDGPGTHLFQSGALIIDTVLPRLVLDGSHLVNGVHKISGRTSLWLLAADSAFGIDGWRIINGLIHEEVAEWHVQPVTDVM